MKSFIVFAALIAYASAKALGAEEVPLSKNGLAALLAEHGGMVPMGEGRIVGGNEIPIENSPWIVTMQRLGSHRCGGSIISTTRILSAAHCTIGIPGDSFHVRAGSTQRDADGQLIATSSVTNHPQYNPQTLNNDVCVMFLSSPLNTDPAGVAVINMLAAGAGVAAGSMSTVAGWGAICEGCAGSVNLRAVSKPILSNAECNQMYGGGITNAMLCAGDVEEGGRDACQGDSGGPLTVGVNLVGVVSWGLGCARPGFPGVYAHVGTLRTWINGQL